MISLSIILCLLFTSVGQNTVVTQQHKHHFSEMSPLLAIVDFRVLEVFNIHACLVIVCFQSRWSLMGERNIKVI